MSYAVTPENALWALLHDATEAYIVDVPRPIKRQLTNYQEIEENLMAVIAEVYGLPYIQPDEVHEADSRILINERNLLMHNGTQMKGMPHTFVPLRWSVDEQGLEPLELPVPIQMWAPHEAENRYLERLAELTFIAANPS